MLELMPEDIVLLSGHVMIIFFNIIIDNKILRLIQNYY